MKPQLVVVILVCTALGLGSGVAYLNRAPSVVPAEAADSSASEPSVAATSAPATKPSSTRTASSTKPAFFTWQQVESEDYKQFIANLREVGCPEQTIRDIIIADVNKLYAAREAPLKAKKNQPTPQAAQPGVDEQLFSAEELEKQKQLREVQLEKRAVLKELLGIDVPLDMLPSSGSRDYSTYELAFSYLPAEKRDAVQTLQENYWQQSDAIKARHKNQRTPEYLMEYRQLSDSFHQELAKILTPQEMEDFDIRTSPTAKKLSTQLAAAFSPTEAEFRQIFRATQAQEEKLARLPANPTAPGRQATPEERQALTQQRQALTQERTGITTQFNEQLKSALGDERYTDYQRSQDAAYERFTRLGQRYGLDKETVLRAYEMEKSFQAQPAQQVVTTDGGATRRVENTAEKTRQLNENLLTILGEKAARGYRRVRGGTVETDSFSVEAGR